MVVTRAPTSTSDRAAGRDSRQPAAPQVHPRRWLHFWRHFLEMTVAMWVGMALGGVLFKGILAAFGTTITEARLHYHDAAGDACAHAVPPRRVRHVTGGAGEG
jgi:hypothetical protein